VAGDQPGDGSVTPPEVETAPVVEPSRDQESRDPGIVWLTRIVILLAVLALVGGAFVFRSHQVRSRDTAGQDRYGAAQQAASDEVRALLNIDYRSPKTTIDKVKAGATADFAKEFDSGTGGLVELTMQARSVMTAEVLWAGVVEADPDSASVIVATTGTVTNTETGDKPAARNFRIKVDLVLQDGRWLASKLDFVEVPL